MSQTYPFPPGYLPPIDVSEAKKAIDSYVAPQSPPKQDENAPALWPMIIAEVEIEAANLLRLGSNTDVARSRNVRRVVDDMKQRHEFGVTKYGVPLVAKNGRDHLSDAYQEFLDAIVYLRAEIEKCGGMPTDPHEGDFRFRTIVRMYLQTIETAIALRVFLAERDGR